MLKMDVRQELSSLLTKYYPSVASSYSGYDADVQMRSEAFERKLVIAIKQIITGEFAEDSTLIAPSPGPITQAIDYSQDSVTAVTSAFGSLAQKVMDTPLATAEIDPALAQWIQQMRDYLLSIWTPDTLAASTAQAMQTESGSFLLSRFKDIGKKFTDVDVDKLSSEVILEFLKRSYFASAEIDVSEGSPLYQGLCSLLKPAAVGLREFMVQTLNVMGFTVCDHEPVSGNPTVAAAQHDTQLFELAQKLQTTTFEDTYYLVDLSASEDREKYYKLISEAAKVQWAGIYHPVVHTFDLYRSIEDNIRRLSCPIIYFVDNAANLEGNQLWTTTRDCTRDKVVDRNANVLDAMLTFTRWGFPSGETQTGVSGRSVQSDPNAEFYNGRAPHDTP